MSNRVVPQVYRAVIDDVIKSIRADYQENGVEDDVLVYLQRRWEANLVETRVARFDSDADVKSHSGQQEQQAAQGHAGASGSNGSGNGNGNGYYQAGAVKQEGGMTQEELLRLRGGSLDDDDEVKPGISDDDDDDDFDDADDLGLGGAAAFSKLSKYAKSSPPPFAGSTSASASGSALPTSINPAALSAPGASSSRAPAARPAGAAGAAAGLNRGNGNAGGSRGIPDENGLLPGDEIIDSDLDDDDEDDEDDDGEGSDAEDEQDTDYMLCVYDKVQRVKNKWKTTFKDGLIHVEGKDYLFSKCTGEFEW